MPNERKKLILRSCEKTCVVLQAPGAGHGENHRKNGVNNYGDFLATYGMILDKY